MIFFFKPLSNKAQTSETLAPYNPTGRAYKSVEEKNNSGKKSSKHNIENLTYCLGLVAYFSFLSVKSTSLTVLRFLRLQNRDLVWFSSVKLKNKAECKSIHRGEKGGKKKINID